MQKLSSVLVLSASFAPTRSPPAILSVMSAHLRSAAAIASLGWLSGCMLEPVKIERTPPPDPTIIMQPVVASVSDALQNFLLQAKKMAPAELAIEKEKIRAEFNSDKSEYSRIKLALLLTLPAPGNVATATLTADDAELAALVDPLATAASTTTTVATNGGESRLAESELKVLALLIQASVQDRKRLREQARDALSRAQVARADSTKTEQEARILRTKVDELEKQLAALKSIERSVNSRTKEKTDPVPKEGAPK